MKPRLLKVITQPNQSFSVRKDEVAYFYNSWHFHPELELLHIQKGSGMQFMGDKISRFKKDDLLLVGPELPHLWRCDDAYFQKNPKLKAVATVVHFRQNFWGRDFLELPENKKIKELLLISKRGISIGGKCKAMVTGLMQDMLKAEQADRIIILLQILNIIANSRNCNSILASKGFQTGPELKEKARINNIYNYSFDHFKEKISLTDIAKIANISPASFSRFFKLNTRKTFSHFLQELRIGHACKLLIENKLSITQVCYASGFNNMTNFYKSFKKITGNSPFEYQKIYLNSEEI